MCGASYPPKIGVVAQQTVVIRLELQLTGDSLTGRVSDGRGAAEAFVGWLGLLGAIDALLPADAAVPGAAAELEASDERGTKAG
jgi:hypothetical protein